MDFNTVSHGNPRNVKAVSSWFQRPGAVVKHHKDIYANKFIAFICQKCQRSFCGPHAALGHYSKCKGITITELPHTCEICNRGFKSLSGLRQHERHLHPEHRLAGRTTRARRPGRALSVWSSQEVKVVTNFMIQITTRRHYDRRLAVVLNDKTPVQIRENVRGLRDQGKLPRPNDVPDGGSSDLDEDKPDLNAHESDDPTEADGAVIEVLATGPEWHTSPTLAWLATGQSGTLEDALRDLIQGQEELSQNLVGEYVTRLTTTIASADVRIEHARKVVTKWTRRPNINRKDMPKHKNFFFKPSDWLKLSGKETSGLLPNEETPLPPAQEVIEQYSTLWDTPGASNRLFPSRPITRMVSAITASEVHARVKKLKNYGAPGADGLTKPMILKLGNYQNILAGLFNIILENNVHPVLWKTNVTYMIPKEDNLSEAGGWRPITLGSVLTRVFSGIIESRITKKITLSKRQMGFVEGNGIAANVLALDQAIKKGKANRLSLAILDISKAFDSVPHDAILQALEGQGVPRTYVQNNKFFFIGKKLNLTNIN